MSVFEKEDQSTETEEEARLSKHMGKRSAASTAATAKPPKAQGRPAHNTIPSNPAKSPPAQSKVVDANMPDWKRKQLEGDQRELDRQEQLGRDKRAQLAALPSADAAPEVNYISPVAPVSAVEALTGVRPTFVCHNCGKGLNTTDTSCRNCGVSVSYNPSLAPQQAAPAAAKPAVAPAMSPSSKGKFCVHCGTSMSGDSQKFCGACGAQVPSNDSSSAQAPSAAVAPPPSSGVATSVFGDDHDVGARERARLENVIDKPGAWIQAHTAKLVVEDTTRKQPDGWVITLSHLPASLAKPVLFQVGMPNPVTVFRGGDGYVSQTFEVPIPKEGRIPFTLEVPIVPFQIRKPMDSGQGHFIKISMSGSDVVFSQQTKPF